MITIFFMLSLFSKCANGTQQHIDVHKRLIMILILRRVYTIPYELNIMCFIPKKLIKLYYF